MVRTLFWAGLQDFHEGLDEKAAGKIIGELGLAESALLIVKAFTGAFGSPGEAADDASPRLAPPEGSAPAGTGAEATASG